MKTNNFFIMLLGMLLVFLFAATPVYAQEMNVEQSVTEGLSVEEDVIDPEYNDYDGYSTEDYPIIVMSSESTFDILEGETGQLIFTIFPEYEDERYNVELYDSNGNIVGRVSTSIYNTSSSPRKVTVNVDTAKLKLAEGEYKVKYWMEFYSLYAWRTGPSSAAVGTIRVIENVCHGNHNYKQDSIVETATCNKEGKARMKCVNCGHITYQSIPKVSTHAWNDGRVTAYPTETDVGIRIYECSVCGTTKTETIPALVTAPAKPYKIANVVSGVHVYWRAVEGAEKYGLWRSETGRDGTYKWVANPTVPHFTDTKVTSGKTYYYKVTILNTDYNVHTNKSGALGITYVSTPDIASRINSAYGIKLGWNKISGATGYAIYRKPYEGTTWTRVATIKDPSTLTWTDASVKANNGTVYKYTIRALAGSNRATLSGCRATGRTMARLTSRTLNGVIKVSDNSIKCNWTASADVSGYEVRFMVGNEVYETFTVVGGNIGSETFKELATGQTYKVQVRSCKKVSGVGVFYSAWSIPKSITL